MARQRGRIILIFGESDNDRSAIVEIARAIKPNTKVRFEKRAKPLVLLRSTEKPPTRRNAAEEIAKLVKAAEILDEVVAVIAHRDCDAVEPAHETAAKEIEDALAAVGIRVPVAATPAFEMEAWWLLFPEAVAKVRPCWEKIAHSNSNVGMIADVKEHLRRCLRPKDPVKRPSCPDYAESDGIAIARKARELGLVVEEAFARSASLRAFCTKLSALPI